MGNMPSMTHEFLVSLFHERPELAARLLAHGLNENQGLPAYHRARLSAAEFRELTPAGYRADAFVCLEDEHGRALEGVIIEIQMAIDPGKHRSWPSYITNARAQHGVTLVALLVVTLDEAVALWASNPIPLDRAGSRICPVVMGPSRIPKITDTAAACADLELALLSVAAHGDEEEAPRLGLAALSAVGELAERGRLDRDRAMVYADFVYGSLSEIACIALEKLMPLQNYQFRSKIALDNQKIGFEQGQRQLVRKQLTRRFGQLPAELDARIDSATAAELDTWGDRLLTAASAAEVFADSSAQ